MRWEDGSPVCPKCSAAQGERNQYWLKAQARWKCYSCRKQFSVKVGTIFEDSPLSLDIWLIAMWMLCNCRNGVSSYEIARATGIAQKNARGEESSPEMTEWRRVRDSNPRYL
jgi:transposase-like protein